MNFEEKTLKKEYIYKGKILNLRKDQILLPNGETALREIVEHTGGSAIYCEMDGKILLVKQFRYPYKKVIYEIPAGKINLGEDPKETAIRELEEEGGIKAKKITKIFEVYPTPGYTEEIIHLYRADDIEKTSMHLDDDEFLTGEWIDKNTVIQMINSGEIKDAKTIIAVLSQKD